MSRKAFFAAHCTHRFDQLNWGEPVRKVKYSSVRIVNPLSALYRVRSISVSRGLFGQSGGGGPLELAL